MYPIHGQKLAVRKRSRGGVCKYPYLDPRSVMIDMGRAACTKCGVEKDVGEFGAHKGKINGRQSWCKECKRGVNSDAKISG